jgi:dihydrofolate synthase / folylpolyglutamate synthase
MSEITNFSEANAALRIFYDNSRTKYDLSVMRALMDFLGNPQNTLRVVHVAGTSGKTSTAYYIAALLQEGGKNVGLSVSPHVDEVNERVQVNLSPLSEQEFCAELSTFLRLVVKSKLKPSYFEVMVAFAYWEFAKLNVDYAVVEVGLGGLLDGTNVISRSDKVCTITDIGLDHTEILGNNLKDITLQKAGIIQPGNEVFMYDQGEVVSKIVKDYCEKQHANLHLFPKNIAIARFTLPLFQQRNLGLAVQVANYVRKRHGGEAVSDSEAGQAAKVTVPARMERFAIGRKTLIVDGSHNAQKLTTLAESAKAMYSSEKLAILTAFVEGPEERWQGGADVLSKLGENVIVTSFAAEQDLPKKSVNPRKVADYIAQTNPHVTVVADPKEAFEELSKSKQDVLLVAGSFYLLNKIRPLIERG